MRITWHRYVPFYLVEDYLRLGWLAHASFLGARVVGEYRVHCEWLCACPLREPAAVAVRIPEAAAS